MKWNVKIDEMVGNALLFVILALLALMFPLSWIGEALGFPFNSLLSGGGIRYFFSILPTAAGSAYLMTAICLAICTSAIRQSGFSKHLFQLISRRNDIKPTYRQRQAMIISLTFLAIYICIIMSMCIGDNSILLNIEGNLFPSHHFMGVILSLLLSLTITAIIYGRMSYQFRGLHEILSVLSQGIKEYAVWLLVIITATLCYDTLLFVYQPS